MSKLLGTGIDRIKTADLQRYIIDLPSFRFLAKGIMTKGWAMRNVLKQGLSSIKSVGLQKFILKLSPVHFRDRTRPDDTKGRATIELFKYNMERLTPELQRYIIDMSSSDLDITNYEKDSLIGILVSDTFHAIKTEDLQRYVIDLLWGSEFFRKKVSLTDLATSWNFSDQLQVLSPELQTYIMYLLSDLDKSYR